MPLSESDGAILDFEQSWWQRPGAKADSIRRELGISASAYYRRLTILVDVPDSMERWPLLVRRLRRQRVARRRVRYEGVAAAHAAGHMTTNGDDEHDIFGPLERSGVVRGWVLVIVAVAIGAALMPSATRANLTASSSNVPTTTAPPASTSSTTTTLAPVHGVTTTTARPDLSTIRVLVANGTNANGAAAAVSSFLSGKGYSTLTPVDALTTVSSSQVYAVNGATADAALVAASLSLPSSSVEPATQPVPVASTGGANVVVIVGPNLTSRSTTRP